MDCLLFKLPISRIGCAWANCRRTIGDWTPLHSAISEDDGEAIQRLYKEEEVELNLVDYRRRTPCVLAVELSSLNALKALVLCGADTSIRGAMFMNDAFCGNIEAVHVCLNSGNHKLKDTCSDENCMSSLAVAAATNQWEITDILLDHNMGVKCPHSTSPSRLDIACLMGNDRVLEVMEKYPSSFAPLERTDSMDFPLFVVMKSNPFNLGHFKCFKQILEHALKIPSGLFDSNGEHAIHVCLRLNRYECLEQLLSTPQIWEAFSSVTVERFYCQPPMVKTESLDGWDRFFHWMRIDQSCSSRVKKLIASRMSNRVVSNFLQWMTQVDVHNPSTYPVVGRQTPMSDEESRGAFE